MLLCRISCELAGCVHQPIVGSGQTNLCRISLAMPAKLNFFKTPTSVRLVQVGSCPLPLEYQAATSHTGRQPCRVKNLYMKRFWSRTQLCTEVYGVPCPQINNSKICKLRQISNRKLKAINELYLGWKTVCACYTSIVYIKYVWIWDTPEIPLKCGKFRNHHREPLFGHGNTFDRGRPVPAHLYLNVSRRD